METKEKILSTWGLQHSVISNDPENIIWKCYIRNPFYDKEKAKWRIGLNRKFLMEAISNGVKKIIVVVGHAEIPMMCPTLAQLAKMDKHKKDFVDIPSMFQGSKPIRLYYFYI